MTDASATAWNQVPTFDELMWPALQALRAMGGSATNEELLSKVIELEQYSPEVQAAQHSDNRQTKLNYNLAWAKTYLKKDGAIQNSSRGVWSLTKEGEQLQVGDVDGIPSRVRKQTAEERRPKELTAETSPAHELGSGHESASCVRFVRTDVELTRPAATIVLAVA